MSQQPSQPADEEYNGLDKLAELIAVAYTGAEDKLTSYLGAKDKQPKDWIYEYLNRVEQEYGTDGILSFIGDLSRLDWIIQELGAVVDDIGHDSRKHEVLKRLRIAEHTAPNGVIGYLNKIEAMKLNCDKANDYHKLLGHGMDACAAIEDLLNSLILFYGGFCQAVVFSAYKYWGRRGFWHTHSKRTEHPLLGLLCSYINDSKLRGSVMKYLERGAVAEMWSMTELLLHLDSYAKNYPSVSSQ